MADKKIRHINIPIFIPHEGCPNACVFCNQHTITQKEGGGALRDIRPEIDECLKTIGKESCECEIAFFGGSFTGIGKDKMIRLLDTAQEYVERGRVESIRLSTRPDFIDGEILDILSRYSVRHIELGIQSLDDRVLALSKRGHTADDTKKACALILERGFSLTGQMMIGLPGATPESEVATAKGICKLGADSARIYPTVVFYDTELCHMSMVGEYTPLENETAAERSAEVLRVFFENGVNVLRIGLQASEGLRSDNIYGGANHSAIGEMAFSYFYLGEIFEKCEKLVPEIKDKVNLTVRCAVGESSKVSGQKKINKEKIKEFFKNRGISLGKIKVFEDGKIKKYCVKISVENIKERGE